MRRDITNNFGKGEGEQHWLPCPRCTATTLHRVRRAVESQESFNGGEIMTWDAFQIVQCQGCRQLSFRKARHNTEDEHYDPTTGQGEPVVMEELYPSRVSGRKELEATHLLPYTVSRLYRETLSAVANKANVLAGIGVRALTEAVCREKNASGGSLEQKIDDLVTQGVLTSDGAAILHGLRLLGNKAAHEALPPSEADLLLALDVVEHLLNTVYLLPKQAVQLPQRPGSA